MAERRVNRRTCTACGAVLHREGEFHPHLFCLLKKAGRDPWEDFRWAVERLGYGPLGSKPPLVRDLPFSSKDLDQGQALRGEQSGG